MEPKTAAKATVALRIFALLALVASLVVLATNSYKFQGQKTTFKDVKSYRYVLATAVIGIVYTLIQIPLAIYHVVKEKRMIRHEFMPEFDFLADKIVSCLLASGVGAGFAVTYEYKGILKQIYVLLQIIGGVGGLDTWKSDTDKFLNRGYIASALLLLGFIFMAIQSVISSLVRQPTKGGYFFR